MILTHKQLEAAAVRAHKAGDAWDVFWRQCGPHVVALEPWDRDAFHRLVRRLTALVAAGNMDGQTAAGDSAPWERDDEPMVPIIDDTTTAARLLWEPESNNSCNMPTETPGN